MSNYSKISSFIWNVCDDVLRGLFKPHEYGDVILPFTVLRRLDCVLEPHKDDMFNIYEQYRTKVDDSLDFYKKITEPKRNEYVKRVLFEDYSEEV